MVPPPAGTTSDGTLIRGRRPIDSPIRPSSSSSAARARPINVVIEDEDEPPFPAAWIERAILGYFTQPAAARAMMAEAVSAKLRPQTRTNAGVRGATAEPTHHSTHQTHKCKGWRWHLPDCTWRAYSDKAFSCHDEPTPLCDCDAIWQREWARIDRWRPSTPGPVPLPGQDRGPRRNHPSEAG
jgi:hypothetical protein